MKYIMIIALLSITISSAQKRSGRNLKSPQTTKTSRVGGANKVPDKTTVPVSKPNDSGRASTERKTIGSFNSLQERQVYINRTLQRKHGDFTFPFKSTKAEADKLGKSFVGENARKSSTGNAWINGNKQYRPPSWKKDLKKYQANFDVGVKDPNTGKMKWISRGHLDIKD